MSPEEIGRLWDQIGKSGLTQYKLKVDLNQDIQDIIERDVNSGPAGGVAPGLTQPPAQKEELFKSVSNKVMDTQLDHTVGAVKQPQR